METPLLSVIVPVYRVEAYLPACLESLGAQCAEWLEIILVDDDSPDACPALCDRFKETHQNVRVIHQENVGLVGARATGLAAATGEYVTFVDSDDWVDEDYFSRIKELLLGHQPDMICVTAFYEERENAATRQSNPAFSGLFSREKLEREVFPVALYQPPFFSFGVYPSLWTKVFRRKLLSECLPAVPRSIRLGEDLAAYLPALLRAQSVLFADVCGYHYRVVGNSMTRAWDPMSAQRIVTLLDYLAASLPDTALWKRQLGGYAVFLCRHILRRLVAECEDIPAALKNLRPLSHHPLVSVGLRGKLPLSVRIKLIAARLNCSFVFSSMQRRIRK